MNENVIVKIIIRELLFTRWTRITKLIFVQSIFKTKMYPFSTLVKETVPNYLSGLPIPDSIGGWFRLGGKKLFIVVYWPCANYSIKYISAVKDWLSLIPPTAIVAGLTYVGYRAFCPHGRPAPCGKVNPTIKKHEAKVVDSVDIEDIAEKAVFCRCWRSKNVIYLFFWRFLQFSVL